MPREDRRIIFSYEEAYKAVYALCMQREMKRPPPGNIETISSSEGDEKILKFVIANRQENLNHEVDYSTDFLAAALMLFCRSQSIPISKKATKTVELKNDNVVLRLVI